MYYIGTKQQCEDYNQEVADGENYQGTTIMWASVIEHPTENKFAILANKKYTSDLETVEKLGSDWYNDPNQDA